jgi:hypothetical protein
MLPYTILVITLTHAHWFTNVTDCNSVIKHNKFVFLKLDMIYKRQYLWKEWRRSWNTLLKRAVRGPTIEHKRFRYDVTTAITQKWSGCSKGKHYLQTDVRKIVRYNALYLHESKKLHLLSASSLATEKLIKIEHTLCKKRHVKIQTTIY